MPKLRFSLQDLSDEIVTAAVGRRNRMSKCDVFDGKQTNWCGLWYHPENGGFSSEAINLSVLKKFKGTVKLYVRKNKFYNKGENNRPNYCFCLKESHSNTFIDIDVKEDEAASRQTDKIDELAEIMRKGRQNGDIMMLPSESQANAEYLMKQAIELVEEITGEEWNFSFITF